MFSAVEMADQFLDSIWTDMCNLARSRSPYNLVIIEFSIIDGKFNKFNTGGNFSDDSGFMQARPVLIRPSKSRYKSRSESQLAIPIRDGRWAGFCPGFDKIN